MELLLDFDQAFGQKQIQLGAADRRGDFRIGQEVKFPTDDNRLIWNKRLKIQTAGKFRQGFGSIAELKLQSTQRDLGQGLKGVDPKALQLQHLRQREQAVKQSDGQIGQKSPAVSSRDGSVWPGEGGEPGNQLGGAGAPYSRQPMGLQLCQELGAQFGGNEVIRQAAVPGTRRFHFNLVSPAAAELQQLFADFFFTARMFDGAVDDHQNHLLRTYDRVSIVIQNIRSRQVANIRGINVKVTFLGTGTSHGVPVIGCDCAVCRSMDPRNHRTRSSILVETGGLHILIDTATEFRLQALRAGIKQIDAVLYTHCHADHVFGFDDLRIFSQRSGKAVPFYGNYDTIAEMLQVFGYVFRRTQEGGGKPLVTPIVVDGPFQVEGVAVTPIPVYHGNLPIYGYRVGDLAYITDCSRLPEASLELLRGLKVLILGVIRHEPHPSHMHVDAALKLVARLKPRQTYFTHITHLLDHEQTNRQLPPAVSLAYDGLIITV